jgi:hypothetical protein
MNKYIFHFQIILNLILGYFSLNEKMIFPDINYIHSYSLLINLDNGMIGTSELAKELVNVNMRFQNNLNTNDTSGTIQPPTPNNSSSIDSNNTTVNQNHTYTIINATVNDTECKPECYLNCQAQFPDITEQKYCIINVCHCQIIESNFLLQKKEVDTADLNNKIVVVTGSSNYVTKDNEKNDYYAIVCLVGIPFLLIIIFLGVGMYLDKNGTDISQLPSDGYILLANIEK